jgi:hypothetical protein
MKLLRRLVRWLGMLFGPGGGTLDPFAGKPAPVKPRGTGPRSSAVAVAEPEDR